MAKIARNVKTSQASAKDNVENKPAPAQSNRHDFDTETAKSAIHAAMSEEIQGGKRTVTLTLYMYEEPATYGEKHILELFRLEPKDRTKWIYNRCSDLSSEFALALNASGKIKVKQQKSAKKTKARKLSAYEIAKNTLATTDSLNKVNAVVAMFLMALRCCYYLRTIMPSDYSVQANGALRYTVDGEEKLNSMRELNDLGIEALTKAGIERKPRNRTSGKAKSSEGKSVMNADILKSATTAIRALNSTDTKPTKDIEEAEDTLLMTLLSRFIKGNKLDAIALSNWFTAHNKAKANNGVSVAKTSAKA